MKKNLIILIILPFLLGASTGEVSPDAVTMARLKYGGGGDWYNDPSIIPNIMEEVQKRTGISTRPVEAVVDLLDPDLFLYPIIFLTGHGNISISPAEVERLREYLERGGFLYVDDDYGLDEAFRREISKVFPEEPLVQISKTHEIFQTPYLFPDGPPKIHDHIPEEPPACYGIFLEGRMVVFYSYNTNFSDGWASLDIHNDPPLVREKAFKMGTNLFFYILTH